MKICILTPRFPFPENGGDVLRINNIARYLKSKGHDLVLVSFVDSDNVDMESTRALYDNVYSIRRSKLSSAWNALMFMLKRKPIQCGYYYSLAFGRLLREVIAKEKPDMYLSHLLRMVPYLEELNLQSNSIVEMTDALSKTYAMASGAKGSVLKRVIYGIEKTLISKYEKKTILSFPKVVLVSQADVDFLRAVCPGEKSLATHTNGVNCLSLCPSSYDSKKICFVGNMRTLQNQDAVFHFVNDIFPLILKRVPDARFYIVGAEPSPAVKALESHNIVVTGFVDDLEAMISDSCIAVAPVRVAAGIQNKVLVAMGCGIPVVMSSLIAGAIPELKDGQNCVISDDCAEFADRCISLINDETHRMSVAIAGYNMVNNHYSWTEKLDGFETF